jgi:TRAP-type uncharacterized transport system fused permease subunit
MTSSIAFDCSAHKLRAVTVKSCREAAGETLSSLIMLAPVAVMIGILLLSVHASYSVMMRLFPVLGMILLIVVLAAAGKREHTPTSTGSLNQNVNNSVDSGPEWMF